MFVVSNLLNFSFNMNKTIILVCVSVMTNATISSTGDTHLWLPRNQTNQTGLLLSTAVIIWKSFNTADTKVN